MSESFDDSTNMTNVNFLLLSICCNFPIKKYAGLNIMSLPNKSWPGVYFQVCR